jgi:dTDP-4-amino-4,6-dideoxygalactose transaminase
MNIDFKTVDLFESKIAEFFNSPYCIALDSCTHGIELCLRYEKNKEVTVPRHTYISVPLLAYKLNIKLNWKDERWENYYYITDKIIDAAVLWKKNSYIKGTYMSLSFQRQKHLNLGRGGALLLDNKEAYNIIKKMSYDGRERHIEWRKQNISVIGYHYYMLPEISALGLNKLDEAIKTTPRQWVIEDWPDVSKMDVFKNI